MNKKEKQILKAAAIPAGALSVLALAGVQVLAAESDDPVLPAEVITDTSSQAQELLSSEPFIEETASAENGITEESPAETADQSPAEETAGSTENEILETAPDFTPEPGQQPDETEAAPAENSSAAGEGSASEAAPETEQNPLNQTEENSEAASEQRQDETILNGDRESAISQVFIPKTDEEGNLHKEQISDWVIERLDAPITAQKISDENGDLLKVDFQIQNVYLGDEAKNGLGGPASTTGQSYINMTNFYVKVLQAKELMARNPGMRLMDALGNEVDEATLDSLIGLLEQISLFDPTTDLKYIWPDEASQDSLPAAGETCEVLATSKDGKASFKFHIDSHGWWRYELAGDTLMNKLMSSTDTEGNPIKGDTNKVLATRYGNFFAIEMSSDENGTWYMLKDTDLEAPYLFVSKDGKKAALMDTDFYGENVLNKILKTLIGENCEELKILITHNNPDHANNLAVIARDPWLASIAEIYWPEGESHTRVNGVDVVSLFDRVHYMKDMEEFAAGGTSFQFIQVPQEHTPMGGAFADLGRNQFFSGDTLGAQIHLGGTSVSTAALDSWISGVQKIVDYIDAHGMKYNFGGHSNYACSAEFAKWMLTALNEAKANLEKDPSWGGLVIIENGQPVTPERMSEMMKNGLSDTEELNVLSVNFRPSQKPGSPDEPEKPEKPEEPQTPSNEKNEDQINDAAVSVSGSKGSVVKSDLNSRTPATAAGTMAAGFSLSALISAAGAILFRRKRK